MSGTQRIEPGHYQTGDGRFEIRHDKAKRQWFIVANDEEAESALRATAHLRGYGRLGDAESWIFGTVFPYLRDRSGTR
jgi:hypothetical protein